MNNSSPMAIEVEDNPGGVATHRACPSLPETPNSHLQGPGPRLCDSRTSAHHECALVAAPRTYLRQTTENAPQRLAPKVTRQPVPGRDVPIGRPRAITQLGFTATIALEDLDPDLLADLEELDA